MMNRWQPGRQWEISGIMRVFYMGLLPGKVLIPDIGKILGKRLIDAIRG
jgi:hypothetical protein